MIEKWKSKALVVRWLTFLWGAMAVFPALYFGSLGVLLGGWAAVPAGLIFSGLLAVLAWGHFKGWRAAWALGLVLSLLWSVGGILVVPTLFDLMRSNFTSGTMSHDFMHDKMLQYTTINLVSPISSWILMLLALYFGGSCAGRTAYGKRPRLSEDSALA